MTIKTRLPLLPAVLALFGAAACSDPSAPAEFPVAFDEVIYIAECPEFGSIIAEDCVDEDSWIGDGTGRTMREKLEDHFEALFSEGASNHSRCQDLYDWGYTFMSGFSGWADLLGGYLGYTEQTRNTQTGELVSWVGALRWVGNENYWWDQYAGISMHEGMHLFTGVGTNDPHHDDFDDWIYFCSGDGLGTAPTWYW